MRQRFSNGALALVLASGALVLSVCGGSESKSSEGGGDPDALKLAEKLRTEMAALYTDCGLVSDGRFYLHLVVFEANDLYEPATRLDLNQAECVAECLRSATCAQLEDASCSHHGPVNSCIGTCWDSFRCDDGKSVDEFDFCDGIEDCADGSDEQECGYPTFVGCDGKKYPLAKRCAPGFEAASAGCVTVTAKYGTCARPEFECASGAVAPATQRCNGLVHEAGGCIDNSDEKGCGEDVQCAGSAEYISPERRCDGSADCPDGSDEKDCSYAGFACGDGTMASKAARCDTVLDCVNGADENGCGYPVFTCADGSFTASAAIRCDGSHDCSDGSDEEDCADKFFDCTPDAELPHRWIPLAQVCDGRHNCPSGGAFSGAAADEADCGDNPSIFICKDGGTIPRSDECDGHDHCDDSSDELGCAALVCEGQ